MKHKICVQQLMINPVCIFQYVQEIVQHSGIDAILQAIQPHLQSSGYQILRSGKQHDNALPRPKQRPMPDSIVEDIINEVIHREEFTPEQIHHIHSILKEHLT